MSAALRQENPAGYLHSLKAFKGLLGTYDATADGGFTIPAAVRVVSDGAIVYDARTDAEGKR